MILDILKKDMAFIASILKDHFASTEQAIRFCNDHERVQSDEMVRHVKKLEARSAKLKELIEKFSIGRARS